MNARFLFILSLLALSSSFLRVHAAQFEPGAKPLVDGVSDSSQVVVTGRSPVLSWEYADTVISFTVTVSTDDVFSPSGELWNYAGSTTAANTINFVTRVPYDVDGNAAPLAAGGTYYWQVTITGDGGGDTASGRFSTVASPVILDGEKFDVKVDWNNPFNPACGQYTLFRFTARDRDRRVQLRVFTLSGELVKDWPEQTVLKDAWYTQAWDGTNLDGEIVARGVYLVNLMDVGEKKGVTRRVVVAK